MLKIDYENDITVVSIMDSQKLNMIIAPQVKEELFALIHNETSKIIFNFEGIVFIDSSGFAALISTYNLAESHKFQFKLCNISMEVMELVEITKLNTVFDISDTLKNCIESFQ